MTTPAPAGYNRPTTLPLEDEGININRYFSLFLSNWYWFAMSLFIALTIAYGINRYSEKVFTVSSNIMIKDDQFPGGSKIIGSVIPGGDIFRSQQNLKNEIMVLKSLIINKRVIDSLPEFNVVYFSVGRRNIAESRLYKSSPFHVITENANDQPRQKVNILITSDSSYTMILKGISDVERPMKYGQQFSEYGFNFKIEPRDKNNFRYNPQATNKFYFYFAGSYEVANYYRGNLSATPIDKDATIVTLSTTGFVCEQEADYLNMLMNVYIKQGLETKNKMADNSIDFINDQLSIVSDSIKKAEARLQKLRLENKLIDLSKDGTLLQNRFEKFENEKAVLELQSNYYQYLKEYLDTKNESGDIVSPNVMGISDPTLARLVQELSVLQQKKKQLSMNLATELPPVNYLEEDIIKTRKAISENLRSNFASIKRSLDEVNKNIDLVNQEMLKLPETESKRLTIQRNFDVNSTVYTYLLEKRAETGIARSSNVSDNIIIDHAEIFNAIQIKPTNRGNYLKALLLGLLVPGVLISLLYYFNNRIIDNGDIIKATSVPIVGYISHSEYKREIPVIDNPKSALSESFRSIRTSLRYFIKESKHPVIAVTSTISSEGKTFVSINLAAVTALLGKKVLLIGLDLRRPRIHKVMGSDNSIGLSTYLSSNCEYGEVIKETNIKNLYYATSGPVPPNPAELIEGERMQEFIDKAKNEFDYIIIDTPPIAIVSDTLLISRFVDVNLFVVRQRYSSKNTLELIQELYQEEKLKNMGIIINDINLSGYYGYGLRYGYYKQYGYSYGKNYYGKYSYGRYGYSDKEHGYYTS